MKDNRYKEPQEEKEDDFEEWIASLELSHGIDKKNVADVCKVAYFEGWEAGRAFGAYE